MKANIKRKNPYHFEKIKDIFGIKI
jgi:hypothetical protein